MATGHLEPGCPFCGTKTSLALVGVVDRCGDLRTAATLRCEGCGSALDPTAATWRRAEDIGRADAGPTQAYRTSVRAAGVRNTPPGEGA